MAPFIIGQSGSYYLTTNLTVPAGDAITIMANNVTLDLGGFTIASTEPVPTGTGILLANGNSGVTILNGHIVGGVMNLGGLFNGSGFAHGITYNGMMVPSNVRVSGVSVSGCMNRGIDLGLGYQTVVESSLVNTVGNYGIIAAVVSKSAASDCGTYAITANTATECYGYTATNSMPGGIGIFAAYTAENCHGQSEGGYGMYVGPVYGGTADNCVGISTGSGFNGGYGLVAITANNCVGRSEGFSAAINARAANNCYGAGSMGAGVVATIANNCFGYSTTSDGISTDVANNCFGDTRGNNRYGIWATRIANNCYGVADFTSTGLYANMAVNCYGTSTSGTGLWAYIANGCVGLAVSGIPVNAAYRYNMP